MSALDRIKERKLFQWAVAYLAAAWLILQVLDLLAQPFAWPALVLRAATVLLAVGFFAVLVVAWYHGEQGRQRVGGVELPMLGGILLIAGVAVMLVSRSGETIAVGGERPPTGSPADRGSPPGSGAAKPPAAEQGSVAVLPFVNVSSDPEQEYFSDGLTEELLNALAQVPGLRVAARTSSFSFKGRNVPVDSVGRTLRVGHVLEGSVRKSGDRVRITAQLIDARSGFHLWSETFDRELRDVFAVQEEISRAVAEQLRVQIAGRGALVTPATTDPEAHTLLLRGIAAHRRGTNESFTEAERLFRQAIQRDPNSARTHAWLANTLMQQANNRQIPVAQGYAEASAAARRALSLDPRESEAHTVLGRIADFVAWRFTEAEEHYQRALASNPADARARSLRAWLLLRLGRREEALAEAVRAVELDPLSVAATNNLGALFSYVGDYRRAVDAYRAALALAPEATGIISNLALTYSELGDHRQAVLTAERALAADPQRQHTLATLGYVYARAGRRADAERALAELRAYPEPSPYLMATVYAALGERERAFELLEQAVIERDDGLPDLGVDPAFANLRGDPRFKRLLRRIGLG